jgi:hypothetical protein
VFLSFDRHYIYMEWLLEQPYKWRSFFHFVFMGEELGDKERGVTLVLEFFFLPIVLIC